MAGVAAFAAGALALPVVAGVATVVVAVVVATTGSLPPICRIILLPSTRLV